MFFVLRYEGLTYFQFRSRAVIHRRRLHIIYLAAVAVRFAVCGSPAVDVNPWRKQNRCCHISSAIHPARARVCSLLACSPSAFAPVTFERRCFGGGDPGADTHTYNNIYRSNALLALCAHTRPATRMRFSSLLCTPLLVTRICAGYRSCIFILYIYTHALSNYCIECTSLN